METVTRQQITAVFAVDSTGGIGLNGKLPWPRNADDMRWFKHLTANQIVVMGRTTWDSPDMPTPLPNRRNIVITNTPLNIDGVEEISGNIKDALYALQAQNAVQRIFVIGGANVLLQAKPALQCVYITKIPGDYKCNTTLNLAEFLIGFELVASYELKTCKVEKYETIQTST